GTGRDLHSCPTRRSSDLMKMVAASKLKRSQDRIVGARPYAQHMLRVLNGLATRVDPEAHPLLAEPGTASTLPAMVIVISADKGRAEEHTSELQSRENLVC